MLIDYRRAAHLTQEQLAKVAGVSPATISRIEAAQNAGDRAIVVHYTTDARLRLVVGGGEVLRGVTTITTGKSAGGYSPGRPAPRDTERCSDCGYELPLTNKCDFCGD